ncbi:MAG: DUF2867 domain-containing protein [Candidatus Hydrogenedentes bacterium]|nr:DUF2867 domain-containing protein [Candidatus Hydrogenedentota bacterium]
MSAVSNPPNEVILVTGASGYIGGRLATRLEETGYRVRCMARRPAELEGRFHGDTEIVFGDVSDAESLAKALEGVSVAYYLVHALGARGDFESMETEAARNFSAAAEAAGVALIVYLGGLASDSPDRSAHMRSRHAVGEILRESSIPVVEFRASIVIGAGSLSFELVRALVRRLPVMITPRWVQVKAQPIAIRDVLDYLTEALNLDRDRSRIYEIGGADALSYLELMRAYATHRGLRRLFIKVPVLTPWLSSLWLSLVTPLFAQVGRKLIDSICVASVVRDVSALRDFPVQPMGIADAIAEAHREEDEAFVQTHWADALSSIPEKRNWGGVRFGSRIVDSRTVTVDTDPATAFAPIQRIGGRTGWYYGNWLWQLRGLLDRAVGGVGMHRGRRDATDLRVGDVVDCWRVEAIEPDSRLLLSAEMKLPGRAWLQFEVRPEGGSTVIRQTATYDPVGLLGLAYWYVLYPIHEFVFAGMLRGIAKATGNPHAYPKNEEETDR